MVDRRLDKGRATRDRLLATARGLFGGYRLTREGEILLRDLQPLKRWAQRWAKRAGAALTRTQR